MKTKLVNLNKYANNKANETTTKYMIQTLDDFDGVLIGIEMGSAYGGGVEEMARRFMGRGFAVGYDTFEGHPKHLAEDQNHFEATCMDYWYREDILGTDTLGLGYQKKILRALGLHNAILVKGEVNEKSCDFLPHINYAFLDMDIYASMNAGYLAVKDKIVKGGYLLLHDVIHNIDTLDNWYNELKKDWEVIAEIEGQTIAVLRKP